MSFRAELLSITVDAVPGAAATVGVQITNSSADASEFTIDVVGLGSSTVGAQVPSWVVTVPGGESLICEPPVGVPESVGSGEHAAALRIRSSRPDDVPVLLSFTLSVSSLAGLEMTVMPSPVRGRRTAKFHVDIVNRESETAVFTLFGDAPGVEVEFDTPSFEVPPDHRVSTAARARGERLWRGEPIQHNLLLTARGRASSATTTVPFVQRPVVTNTPRTALAVLLLLGLWAGLVFGGVSFLRNRDEAARDAAAASITGVDTDGDGVADVFYDENGLVVAAPEGVDDDGDGVIDRHLDESGDPVPVVVALDTDGDGVADMFVDENGEVAVDPSIGVDGSGDPDQIATSATPDERDSGSDDGPTTTRFRGKISVPGGGDVTTTQIVVRDIVLDGGQTAAGATPETTAFNGVRAAAPSKIWSARRPQVGRSGLVVRQSEPVDPLSATPGEDGIWEIADVDTFKTYEVSFVRPGFQTQSFVIIPPEDGEPVEIDVELEPGAGAIRGRVIDSSGEPVEGAELHLTDGTVALETRSENAAEGASADAGAFNFEQLSTPEVYTVSVSRRGFGTEVVQIELGPDVEGLEPGERGLNRIVDVVLTEGVGTITGSVFDQNGQPLPGATVVATDGETTRTTSSLTDGAIGSFAIPQLEVSNEHTVSVELDGYTSDARRVSSGQATNVDFVLNRTTSRISGQVSSSTGGGIVAAGVIVSNGELEFKASTTNAPRGFFAIDDLPPGNYTVTVEHFQHETTTQFIEVTAGVDRTGISIVLPRLGSQPSIGTGSLVVEVIDADAETTEERPVAAVIELFETRTRRNVPTPREPADTVRIENIPPGTYTLIARADQYSDSPAQQVTIGLQEERRQIEIRRQGAAGGVLIDSITDQAIPQPWQLRLLRVIGNQEAETDIPIRTGDPEEIGAWSTPPRSVDPGEYRITFGDTGAPRGYRVLEDQRLVDGASGPMRFLVDPAEPEVSTGIIIEADPFPEIYGRVFTPVLTGTRTDLVPLESDSLRARLNCDDGDGDIEVTPFSTPLLPKDDQSGPSNEFFISKEDVDDGNLTGDCWIDLTADSLLDTRIQLPNLVPSDGSVRSDRVVNAAMYSPVDTIGGSVFWRDPRKPASTVPLDGVAIATESAIVGFPPTAAPPPPPGERPGTTRSELDTESELGAWALQGQIFGPAEYTVNAAGFPLTSFNATIDDDAVRTVTVSDDITMTPSSPSATPVGEDIQYQLELTDPDPGGVAGEVTILTNDRGSTPYAGLTVTASPPDPTEADIVIDDPAALGAGTFSIPDAAAGTWDVEFGLPRNHIVLNGGSNVVGDLRVEPGTPRDDFDITLVEEATVTVNLTRVDSSDRQVGVNPVVGAFTYDLRPVGTGTAGDETGALGTAIENVAVDADNPLGATKRYELDLSIPGFEPTGGRLTVSDQTGILATSSSLTNIPVDVRAGSEIVVEVRLQEYGSIGGPIRGVTSEATDPSAPEFSFELLDLEPDAASQNQIPAEVIVKQLVSDGLLPPREVDPPPELQVFPEPNGFFRVSAPAGTYRVTVTHPEFEPSAPRTFVIQTGVSQPEGAFDLVISRANLELDVFDPIELETDPAEFGRNEPVTRFTYTLTRPGFTTRTETVTPVDGKYVVTDLVPGTWRLEIRDGNDRFPFIAANVVVERSNRDNPDQPETTEVRAPLPQAGATISGTVTAQNSDDVALPLPDVQITRTYQVDVADLGGTVGSDELPNEVDASSGFLTETVTVVDVPPAVAPDPPDAPDGEGSFEFTTGVANGPHEVELVAAPAGFGVEGSRTRTAVVAYDPDIAGSQEEADQDFVVEALDVNPAITVTPVGSGAFVDVEARLFRGPQTPAADATSDFVATGPTDVSDSEDKQFRFTAVPPSTAPYILRIRDPLYGDLADGDVRYQDFQVTVPVGTGGLDVDMLPVGETVSQVGPKAKFARVTGVLTQGDDPLAAGATVTLTKVIAGVVSTDAADVFSVEYDADGSYEIDVPVGVEPHTTAVSETYNLRIEPLSTSPFSPNNVDVSIVNGATTIQALGISQLAQVTVNTTPTQLPDGVIVQLEQRVNGGRNVLIPVVPGSPVFVEPGEQYRVRVSGTYPTTFFTPNDDPWFRAEVAAPRQVSVVLERVVTVNVTNPPPTLAVVIVDGAERFTPRRDGNSWVQSFAPLDTNPSALTIEFTVDGSVVGTIPTDTSPAPLVAARFVTITGELALDAPAPTVPTGKASATVGPNAVRLTATSGTTTLVGEVTAGNTYKIEGLASDLAGPGSRSWVLEFDGIGFGRGTANTPILNTSPVASPGPQIPVTAVEYQVSIDVNGLGGVDVIQPVVAFTGTNANLVTPTGATTFTIKESLGTLNWVASDETGTLVPSAERELNTAQRPSQTPLPLLPDVTLTQKPLTISVAGAPTNTTVRVCKGTPSTAPCATLVHADVTVTGANFRTEFTAIDTPGTDYFVQAVRTTPATNTTAEVVDVVNRPFEVRSDGSVEPTNASTTASGITVTVFPT